MRDPAPRAGVAATRQSPGQQRPVHPKGSRPRYRRRTQRNIGPDQVGLRHVPQPLFLTPGFAQEFGRFMLNLSQFRVG